MKFTRQIGVAGTTVVMASTGALVFGSVASAHTGHQDVVKGTVTALNAGRFEVLEPNNTKVSIATDGSTTYEEMGSPVRPGRVAVGNDVVVKLDPTGQTPTASQVEILLESVGGVVTNANGASITLRQGRGPDRIVDVSSGTKFYEDGQPVSGAVDGQDVRAYGAQNPTNRAVIDAFFIDIKGSQPKPMAQPMTAPPGLYPNSSPVVPPRHGQPATASSWSANSHWGSPHADGNGGPGPRPDGQDGPGDGHGR